MEVNPLEVIAKRQQKDDKSKIRQEHQTKLVDLKKQQSQASMKSFIDSDGSGDVDKKEESFRLSEIDQSMQSS